MPPPLAMFAMGVLLIKMLTAAPSPCRYIGPSETLNAGDRIYFRHNGPAVLLRKAATPDQCEDFLKDNGIKMP